MTVTEYPEFTQSKEFRSGVSIETNFQIDDTTRMSVDSAGAAHIMSLLTDLYSDPEGSVIREYISNAYDSHAAAGQTRPIEVSLPGAFDPTFIVKDFGTGMSASEVRTIYGSYGMSTKRDKFDQIGAFGLGCKSALTMTQQFTLIAVKDGHKSVAIIARGEDGVGEIKMISADQPTEEPNGVEVKIPVQRHTLFRAKAEKFFFALPKDSILVDGNPPAKSLFDGDYFCIESLNTRISRNSFSIYDDDDVHGFSVIAGGVLYPVNLGELSLSYEIKSSLLLTAISRTQILPTYATIPLASIDLTPSREGIRYSDRTKKFLTELIKSISEKFAPIILDDVSSAKTRSDALRRVKHYSTVFGSSWASKLKWGEEPIPAYIDATGYLVTHRGHVGTTEMTIVTAISMLPKIDLGYSIYYVEGPDSTVSDEEWKKFVKDSRRDFKGWREHTNSSATMLYIFRGKAPTSPWFASVGVFKEVSVADLRESAKAWRKIRRAEGAKNRASGDAPTPITYPVISLKDENSDLEILELTANDLVDGDVYIEEGANGLFDTLRQGSLTDQKGIKETIKNINGYGTRFVWVANARKVSALVSRAKGVDIISWVVFAQKELDKSIETMSTEQIGICVSMMQTYYVSRWVSGFKALMPYLDEIGDDELKKFGQSVQGVHKEYTRFVTLVSFCGAEAKYISEYRNTIDLDNMVSKYALLDMHALRHYNVTRLEHMALYMKAVNSQGKDV